MFHQEVVQEPRRVRVRVHGHGRLDLEVLARVLEGVDPGARGPAKVARDLSLLSTLTQNGHHNHDSPVAVVEV